MADRTSAGIFGSIFEMLAESPTDEHKQIAKRIFEFARGYDFSPYQMDADESCITLGVAKRGINPKYPEDGEVVLWLGDEGIDQ